MVFAWLVRAASRSWQASNLMRSFRNIEPCITSGVVRSPSLKATTEPLLFDKIKERPFSELQKPENGR